jgi:glycosyltransferase involved in cell wall biosynthesis
MWHFGHITTWFLLVTKFLHKKKITIWGQGISVKRYLKEEKNVSLFLKKMASMADTIWVYTEKEKKQWENIFPNKEIVALNNTISGIEKIVAYKSEKPKKILKTEYKITQPICFIFCARFNNEYRRQDLLLQIIKTLDNQKFGFIIIGDGEAKPDFSSYANVYDYGAVYSDALKQDLFTISDLYIQPGWVGLSVVEALGYGKPVVTFKRSETVLQCVEYNFLIDCYNAFVFSDIDVLVSKIKHIKHKELEVYQSNSKDYVIQNLMMSNMVGKALSTIKKN